MDFTRRPSEPVHAGQEVALHFELLSSEKGGDYEFQVIRDGGGQIPISGFPAGPVSAHLEPGDAFDAMVLIPDPGEYTVQFRPNRRAKWEDLDTFLATVREDPPVLRVALQSDTAPNSNHVDLWQFIRDVSGNLRFGNFALFAQANSGSLGAYPAYGSLTYDNLHQLSTDFVTESALGNEFSSSLGVISRTGMTTSTSWGGGPNRTAGVQGSYVHGQANAVAAKPFPNGIPDGPYPLELVPFVELIYVYWLEEAMLFQSLNRILARFQNRRAPGGQDPLSRLAVSPLLPLRGILWGLAEGEKDRLSLRRRAAEYEYQYGLQLIGRAIPPAELLVERRTQFLEAFHSLLNACHHFYKELSDKTVDADAFPLLSNLRELHLVLANGANNQFADVSLIARIETMDVQWMLAQPEMREFLGGRTMVPYDEPWMDRVDTMKSMQGWSGVSVTHFYDLAFHGEQLLLSVRHGRWNDATMTDDDAKNWAITWKPSVQRYIHAYRAVTGVDLSERVDTTMPSTLLQRRLAQKLVRY